MNIALFGMVACNLLITLILVFVVCRRSDSVERSMASDTPPGGDTVVGSSSDTTPPSPSTASDEKKSADAVSNSPKIFGNA